MKKYLYFIFFVTLWSCSADKVNVKSEDNSFYSVDLRIIEKTKGTVMSLGDLMESYETLDWTIGMRRLLKPIHMVYM